MKVQKVGFDLKDKAKYNEKELLDAINQAYPGSKVLKKPNGAG